VLFPARQQGKLEEQQSFFFFQRTIRFHPDHPWPKALIYSVGVLVELFKQKQTIILGFHHYITDMTLASQINAKNW